MSGVDTVGTAALPLVDTHCHLVLCEERGLLDAALSSAVEAGVEQLVTVGLDLADSDRNRRIAEAHTGVFFSVGWHPHTARPPSTAELAALGELLSHPLAVAVGEIGLDHFWRQGYHEVPPAVQLASLRAMLELAVEHGKPVIVHDRDAHDEVVLALERGLDRGTGDPATEPAGVLHCFSGDVELAASARRLRMLCSFAGTITFKGSDPIRAAARSVGDDDYVVETDSPFLAPVPHRGKDNLPGFVAATAAALAELRGEPLALVGQRSTANARRLFRLAAADGARLGG